MSDLYKVLGVSRQAAPEEIRKAYRRLALEKHPDRGGDKEEFQRIQEANEILSNPESKAHYDATGRIPGAAEGPGMGGGVGMPPDLASVLGSMFGGAAAGGMPFGFSPFGFGGPGGPGGPGPRQKAPRGPNKIHDIGVTLQDVWHGKRVSLKMNRDVKCSDCHGQGGHSLDPCSMCGGHGMRQIMQQMGPMMTVRTEPCGSCRGSGKTVQEKNRCKGCKGERVLPRENMLEVVVEPGMQEGDRITFPSACSESPDFDEPGDVVLVVRAAAEKESQWVRKGADLATEMRLTWGEALIGWGHTWNTHPSGRPLRIVWRDGPIRDGEVLRVAGWGMPVRPGSGFGDLRIVCRVEAGTNGWTAEQVDALRKVWPSWKEPDETGELQKAERCP